MKTFIVYGANGFIGSSLVEELAKDSLVYAVDRYSREPVFKKSKKIKIVKTDIAENYTQHAIKADGVIWTVGGVIPTDTLENKSILELIKPTVRILEPFMQLKTPIILVSSAGMLYKPEKRILTENSAVEPWTWYGLQKQVLEKSLTLLSNEYENNDFTIFRVTSVYGERQPTNRNQGVVGKLIRSSLLDEKFPLYGSEKVLRDYVHVKDLAKIINLALRKRLNYKIYNVSSGQLVSIAQLKEIIENITKQKIRIDMKEKRVIDPNQIQVSNKRLLKELSNLKFISLENGLESTVKWYKSNL